MLRDIGWVRCGSLAIKRRKTEVSEQSSTGLGRMKVDSVELSIGAVLCRCTACGLADVVRLAKQPSIAMRSQQSSRSPEIE